MCVTVDGVLDLWLDLLTTYTHNTEVQVIRAQSISPQSTKYVNTRKALSILLSSPAIPW
jgi:hypothetical protein